MRIDRINLYKIKLPFVGDFSHSLKTGAFAVNVVAEVVGGEPGHRGYGEAAPRPYVTGETPQSVLKCLNRLVRQHSFPWELNDISQVWGFIDSLPVDKFQNAAICAIETALLDALGKDHGIPAIEYFPGTYHTETISYGAAIHLGNEETVMSRCRLIQRLGLKQIRIKMDGDFVRNNNTMKTVISVLGRDCDLRLDINGAWDSELARKHIPLIKAYPVKVVEQPLNPQSTGIAGFAKAMQAGGIRLMADEAACSLNDMEKILKDGYYDMINVRLSKCGGLRRSLNIIDVLRDNGLAFQIGCQLGESGLLSAAGRMLSLLCKDALYHDGSYDRFLLKENITCENVSFGPGGAAGPLTGPGLGVRVAPRRLERLNKGLATESILRP